MGGGTGSREGRLSEGLEAGGRGEAPGLRGGLGNGGRQVRGEWGQAGPAVGGRGRTGRGSVWALRRPPRRRRLGAAEGHGEVCAEGPGKRARKGVLRALLRAQGLQKLMEKEAGSPGAAPGVSDRRRACLPISQRRRLRLEPAWRPGPGGTLLLSGGDTADPAGPGEHPNLPHAERGPARGPPSAGGPETPPGLCGHTAVRTQLLPSLESGAPGGLSVPACGCWGAGGGGPGAVYPEGGRPSKRLAV